MKKLILLQFLLLFLSKELTAQAPIRTSMEWFQFDNQKNVSIHSLQDCKNHIGLSSLDKLIPLQSREDLLGHRHTRHQHYYKDILVHGSMFITHEKDGFISHANGNFIKNLSLDIKPTISKYSARNFALQLINAKIYAWESEKMEATIKQIKGKDASFFPEGKLVVFSPEFDASTARLAYEFEIFALNPLEKVKLYLDAHTGDILSEIHLLHEGSGDTKYNGPQNITCEQNINGTFSLKETGFRNIETKNYNQGYALDNPAGVPFVHDSPDWEDKDSTAISVHWASEKFYDYLDSSFNWNSYDGNGAMILNMVHYGEGMNNAFWNGAWASYGDGDGIDYNPWVSLDIVAHELTHGLIQSTADLIYQGESGALNESFADIFAVMIERYAEGGNNEDWKIAEDVTMDGNGIRSFENPSLFDQPSQYGEYIDANWYNGQSDHGGVHTNSGVQNHWFYLLSNEIDIDNAAAICFHSLTNYLSPYSTYTDARNASIQSAIDLFGSNSNEKTAVCNTWTNVAVFGNCPENHSINITPSLEETTLTIDNDITITWGNTSNISHVNIEYAIGNSTDWLSIVNYHPSSTFNNYIWHVPQLNSDSIISIRISDASNYGIYDIADSLSVQNCPVTAEFTGSNYVCIGDHVNYINTSINASTPTVPSNYGWSNNSTSLSTDVDLLWMPNTIGSSEIELRAYDSNTGCQNSTELEVFVADSTDAVANFSYQQDDLGISFLVDDIDPYATYTWSFGDGQLDNSNDTQPFHEYSQNGIYTVCLTVGNSCGDAQKCKEIVALPSDGSAGLCADIWTIFDTSNSPLPTNYIRFILNDSANNIWAGTQNGLIKYDGTNWVIFNTSNSDLPGNAIRSLFEDAWSNIWVGTSGGGLAKYDGTNWVVFNTSNSGLPSNNVRTVIGDVLSNIWVGTYGGELAKYDGTSWVIFNTSNSDLPGNIIHLLFEDAWSNIWVGTEGGLVKYDGANWEIFNTSNSDLPGNNVRTIVEDTWGNIWVGTEGGLVKYDGANWEIFNTSNSGLVSNVILSLFEDIWSNIWIGTAGGGLAKYDGTNWLVFNTSNSLLPNNYVYYIAEDTLNNTWIGTYSQGGGGLAKLETSINFSTSISCAQDSSFFQNASGASLQSKWYIDGDSVSSSANLNYYFEHSGTYEVTLVSTDSEGCKDAFRKTVIIPAAAQELFDHLPASVSICQDSSSFIDVGLYTYTSYLWEQGDSVLLEDTTAILEVSQSGTYFLTVIDSCGGTATDSVIVELGEDCVWPGDTDKDGKVTNRDIFAIGLAYGATGDHRLNMSTDWAGWAAPPWLDLYFYGDSTNYKHADTNGDGTIDLMDLEAILINYGKTHSESNPEIELSPANAPYGLTAEFEGLGTANNEIRISLKLQNNQDFAVPFYGLSVTMNYEGPFVSDSTVNPINVYPEVIGGDVISVHRYFPDHTDIAFVGTNHQNRSLQDNYGATSGSEMLNYTIGDEMELSGGSADVYLRIIPEKVLMINNQGHTIPVKGKELDIYLIDTNNEFVITTNPVSCDIIGSATIHPTDSSISYSYEWSTGDTTATILAPTIGVHEVTVTYGNSNVVAWEGSVNLEGMEALELVIEDNGDTLTATVNGGDGNYLYFWSNGSNTASIPKSSNTDYSVTVIDGNGCSTSSHRPSPDQLSSFANIYGDILDENLISFLFSTFHNAYFGIFRKEWLAPGNSQYESGFAKVDMDGNLEWITDLGNNYTLDYVLETNNGDFLLSGRTQETDYKICTIRMDGSGNIIWEKIYDAIGNLRNLQGIFKSEGNSYYMTSWLDTPNGYSDDILIIRIDGNGNEIWSKRYYIDSSDDQINDSYTTIDGGLVFVYNASGITWENAITKIDKDGNIVMSNRFTGSSLNNNRISFRHVVEAADGGYLIGINNNSVFNTYDLNQFAKLNAAGEIVWIREFVPPFGLFSSGRSIISASYEGSNGDSYWLGYSDNDNNNSQQYYLFKLDDEGNMIYSKLFDSSIDRLSFTKVEGDKLIFSGKFLDHPTGYGQGDGLLMVLDTTMTNCLVTDMGVSLSAITPYGNSATLLNVADQLLVTTTANTSVTSQTYPQESICTFYIYVDETATGLNDGSSWANAFTDLQDALAVGPNTTIYIAEGTYYPTSGTSKGISFDLPDACQIIGGYPNGGGIADPLVHETILSGNIDGVSSYNGNSYHVVTAKSVDDVILNGLTIRDGNANNANSFGRSRGGGIFVNNALVKLNNVIVEANKAIYGGGMFATLSGNLEVNESTFRNNTADSGSAIYHSNETQLYIKRSKIIDNISLVRAAIEVNNSLFTRIENSVIANNSSTNANAVSFIATNRNGLAEIVNSTILGEANNKNLITMQVGFGDQLDISINNSIIAHQNISFDKAFKEFNNGVLNLTTNNCYIQGSGVIGTSANNLYSATDGALILDNDYSLMPCSTGEDAGLNTWISGTMDVFGNPRTMNGTVDIGAYEVMIPCGNIRKGAESDSEGLDVQIFPNPTKSIIQIESDIQNLSFELHDILGRTLLRTTNKELDVSEFPKGIYILKIKENQELLGSEKIIKE